MLPASLAGTAPLPGAARLRSAPKSFAGPSTYLGGERRRLFGNIGTCGTCGTQRMMGVDKEVGKVIALRQEEVRALAREMETDAAKQTPTMVRLISEVLQGIGATGGELILRPMTDQGAFLTTAQVAEMFQVSDRVVRKWCETGRLKATRIGDRGEWHIHRSQFAAGPEEVRHLLDTVTRINSRFQGEEIDDYE